jgi:hypothetical protein
MTDGVKTQGLKLQLGSTASPQTFTDLANITNLTGLNSGQSSEIDTTDFDSENFREFVRGLADGGQVTVNIKWDPDLSTHQTLFDLNRSGATRQWRVVLVQGTIYEFNAFISNLGIDFAIDDIVRATMTLRVTGNASQTV